MTPDERNMLNDLAGRIAQTPPPPKDAEAEEFIRARIGNRPDALYLMTQTVLIQNLALQHAQQQVQELQQRAGQPVPAGSGNFLGGSGGSGYSQGNPQQQYSAPPAPQYGAPQSGAPQYSAPPASNPSGAPSFLRGAAQTAAGVAAGALAFEGIRSLFSHPGYGYGGGGFMGGGGGFLGGGAPVDETVVNNYYDNPSDTGRDDYQNAGDTGGPSDDSGQYDNSGQDDGSNSDDGGGFDDNSGGTDFS